MKLAYPIRLSLWIALRRPAGNTIPRTGPRTKGLNNFVVQLGDADGDWPILVKKLEKRGVLGDWWNENSYNTPISIPNAWLKSTPIQITHYVEAYEFRYRSTLSFLMSQIFFRSFFLITKDKIEQLFFNQRKLVRSERMEILRLILEGTIKDRQFSLSSTSLMNLLYSNRWVFHPEKNEYLAYCRFLLDSLVQSGDLRQQDLSYHITPKALSTLAEFEQQEQKHRDQVSQQKVLGRLTFALVIIGVIQAYVTWAHP